MRGNCPFTVRIDSNTQQLQSVMEAAEADRSAELQATRAALEGFSKQEQRLRENKTAAIVAMQDAKQALSVCTASLAVESDKLQTASKAIEAIEKDIEKLDKHRRDLQYRARNGDSVRQFGGHSMERLRQLMSKNESKFTRPPIGPLGYHLDLEDDGWGAAAQAAIGMLLDTVFVVHDWRDKQMLQVRGKRLNVT